MNSKIKTQLKISLGSIIPIIFIVFLLSIFVVPVTVGTMMLFFLGSLFLIVGMALFDIGADLAMNKIGEGMGIELAGTGKRWLILFTAFLMGFLVTIAEPDLKVLAQQVPAIPDKILILTVATGVGLFLMLAVIRILNGLSLSLILMILYSLILVLSFLIPDQFLGVAYDSGGVTTGPITVPFIMSFGVGLSELRLDKDSSNDSFGLIALASGGPIIAVMILGTIFAPENATVTEAAPSEIVTMQDAFSVFADRLLLYIKEVGITILPLLGIYGFLQILTGRYRSHERLPILIGFGYTWIGLSLFLCGVNEGFSPLGRQLGYQLGQLSHSWILIPLGMAMGYYTVKAEPAIQTLNKQVASVTNGTIPPKDMDLALSVGVSLSVGLATVRILYHINLMWFVLPGYALALVLTRFVSKLFVGIAFDSGGVASGPMTSTFLLPLCIGACQARGGNIMTDAFGLVSLVALTPLIAIQLMGLKYQYRTKKAKQSVLCREDDEIIIDFSEDSEVEG